MPRKSNGARTFIRIFIFTDSENYKRDFVCVSDVCKIHEKMFDIKEKGIYNIGTGKFSKVIINIKKQILNILIKTFIPIMFLAINSGCSLLYKDENSSKELNNKYNREIIINYSKAISKIPDNFLFYLERGRAKHDFGDYVGAIMDFNASLSINNFN